jgi:hypothetical protein
MDAIEFVKQLRRMNEQGVPKNRFIYPCTGQKTDSPEEVVAEVEEWAKDHPIKTRQSEFLKMFPNVILNDKGQPSFCAKLLDTTYHPVGSCCLDVDICQRCMDNFWGQEVEDI